MVKRNAAAAKVKSEPMDASAEHEDATTDVDAPPAKRLKQESEEEAKMPVPLLTRGGPFNVMVGFGPGVLSDGCHEVPQEIVKGFRFGSETALPQAITTYDAVYGALKITPLLDAPYLQLCGFIRPGADPGLPLWTQVHIHAGARAIMWLEVETGSELARIYEEAASSNGVVIVKCGPDLHSDDFELCLVPAPTRKEGSATATPPVDPSTETVSSETSQDSSLFVKQEVLEINKEPSSSDSKEEAIKKEPSANTKNPVAREFLVYAIPVGSVGQCSGTTSTVEQIKSEEGPAQQEGPSKVQKEEAEESKIASEIVVRVPGILSRAQLGLVCGIEHTLACVFDLVHTRPPRETEFAMLQEFDQNERVSLAGGTQIVAQMEGTWLDDLVTQEDLLVPKVTPESNSPKAPEGTDFDQQHPVVRLSSADGELVLTKIACGPKGTHVRSILVHIRPGWPDLRRYILNANAAQPADPQQGPTKTFPLFRVFGACKQARSRREALELWRLLDPDGELLVDTGGTDSLQTRIYSHSTDPERSIDAVLEKFPCEQKLSMAVDNSTRWFGRSGLAKVWPVRPYEPYSGNQDVALSAVLHAIHAIRNMFYERSDQLTGELSAWVRYRTADLSPFLFAPQPSVPDLMQLVQFQKHRWLQEFQAPETRSIPRELASAKDFADPILRNKWHLIVDTNVLHHCASDRFELFHTLEHTHGDSIVMIIPFATVHELDWQKHHVKNPAKLANATASIRYLNSQVSAGSRFIVMQSVSEDAPFAEMHKHVKPFNAQNDMRVFECARIRHAAGLRTLVLSGDTNLRNVCMSSNVPAVRFQPLWGMLTNPKFQRLSPEHWLRALQKFEQDKQARIQKHHANQQALR